MNVVTINRSDAVLLAYCLDVMKGQSKETLRKNLGIRQGKKQFKVYKSILKMLEDRFIEEEEDGMKNDFMIFEFDQEQSEVARDFITSFTATLEKKADEEGQIAEEIPYYEPLQNTMLCFLVAESDRMAVV